jgi:ketosteroid isomerase-like protein
MESPFLHRRAADALLLAARPLEDGSRPVAVVLADGTVRALASDPQADGSRRTGRICGPDWIFWWHRRDWARAS